MTAMSSRGDSLHVWPRTYEEAVAAKRAAQEADPLFVAERRLRRAQSEYDALMGAAPPQPTTRRTPRPDLVGMVYVASSTGRVKIGFSRDVERRLGQLNNACPYPVKLLASFPGSLRDEAALHGRFASSRIQGEWFEPDAEMRAWLDGLA